MAFGAMDEGRPGQAGTSMDEKTFVAGAALDEVPPGKKLLVTVNGVELLLCNDAGSIHAVASLCSHAEQSLECGLMRHGWLACPIHGARFDLETGEPLNPPASEPIAVYPVRVVDGMIEVAV